MRENNQFKIFPYFEFQRSKIEIKKIPPLSIALEG